MTRSRTHLLLLCGIASYGNHLQALAFQPLTTVAQRNQKISSSIISFTGSGLWQPKTKLSHQHHRHHQQFQVSLSASSSSNSDNPARSKTRRRRRQLNKDVVIVGGGLAGLSAALYLSQIDPDRHITILDKEPQGAHHNEKTSVASFAAAGMLAPQSERLPKGHYLDLCLESKQMFPSFCDLVESLAQEAGEEGAPYLVQQDADDCNGLEPWNIGYVASGGFLAPAFAGDNVATWAPPEDTKGTATWLDATQVRELEPYLHPDVVGGWWFPEDASVDARRLTCSLRAACVGAGVQYLSGPNYEVSSLDLEQGHCQGLWLKDGKYISTKSILVANGAWMRTLLPVPLEPHKGQSLSLRMPKDQPPILRRVLFAQDSYIVPKADGRIVIGATVEAGSYDPNVTPAGIMHILSYALQLVPALADLPLEETWAGLRPTTPDKGPILGETPWKNLYLAGGYWRNGVLLAPKTGELLASLIAGEELSEEDRAILKAFSWDRFTSPGGGTALAANTRYAASMYPIHTRKSGVGVAAAVGTELGSYSTARSAGDERRKDRASLWAGGEEDAFERAAAMGKQDGSVFSFGEKDSSALSSLEKKVPAQPEEEGAGVPSEPLPLLGESQASYLESLEASTSAGSGAEPSYVPYDGSPDAFTVGYAEETDEEDLQSIYSSIRENKSKQQVELGQTQGEVRPDPGFRIYHVDQETGLRRVVPPYTTPGHFLASMEQAKEEDTETVLEQEKPAELPKENGATQPSGYSETTYDGYEDIIQANADDSRDVELKAMKEARRQNRLGQPGIVESDLHL